MNQASVEGSIKKGRHLNDGYDTQAFMNNNQSSHLNLTLNPIKEEDMKSYSQYLMMNDLSGMNPKLKSYKEKFNKQANMGINDDT